MDIKSSYTSNNPLQTGQNKALSIQSWKNPRSVLSAQNQIEHNLNRAADGKVGPYHAEKINTALSLSENTSTSSSRAAYEFKDVLDIINPLHHIPVVGTLYRGVTGDELKPASRLIGGSIFGGPVGAVASTINIVSEMQTGKDLNDHALNMMGFSSAQKTARPNIIYQQYQEMDNLRTANWDQGYSQTNNQTSPNEYSFNNAYDPITTIAVSPMPPRTLIDA